MGTNSVDLYVISVDLWGATRNEAYDILDKIVDLVGESLSSDSGAGISIHKESLEDDGP